MPENNPAANERTVVVQPSLFGILTFVSLTLNALVLLLLLLGIAFHHRPPMPPQHSGQDRDWADGGRHGGRNFHHHRFAEDRGGCDCGGSMDRARGGWARHDDEDRCGCGADQDEDNDQPRGSSGGPMDRGSDGSGWMKEMRPPTAMELTDHIMDHLTEELVLTDPETTQIRPVIEQQVAALQKDMESQQQARLKSIEDTTARIRPMLNAGQQKQLDEMKAADEEKMDPAKPGAPAAADQTKTKT